MKEYTPVNNQLIGSQQTMSQQPITTRHVLGFPILNEPMAAAIARIIDWAHHRAKTFIVVASSHVLVTGRQHADYSIALNTAGMILPDGKPISVLMNWLHKTSQERIAGADLLPRLLKAAEQQDIPVFFWAQPRTFSFN